MCWLACILGLCAGLFAGIRIGVLFCELTHVRGPVHGQEGGWVHTGPDGSQS